MYWDMLTPGAAQHGHEYSESQAPSNIYESFLARSPLSILTSVYQKPNAPVHQADATSTPTAVHSKSAAEDSKHMFDGSNVPVPPSSDASRPTSVGSALSLEAKPKKRGPRSKTTYNLAHPPPVTAPRRKLHLRPDTLLQLHQVVPSKRPKPVYDLVSPCALNHRLTRKLARACPSREKHLGPNDIVLVKAGEYGLSNEDDEGDDEKWCDRAIAVICVGKRDDKGAATKTTITMDDFSCWEASPLPNGGYEITSMDEHGLHQKCRWIARPAPARRVSGNAQLSPNPWSEDKKFKFSTVTPGSRRHPFIATMTRSKFDIQDFYEMPSASCASPFQSPLATPSNLSDADSFDDTISTPRPEDFPIETTDALRKLIVVSGIWVALSENWSAVYSAIRTSCSPALGSSSPGTAQGQPSAPRRSISLPLTESPRMGSRSPSPDGSHKRIPKMMRSTTQLLQRNRTIASPDTETAKTSRDWPRRSNSTGAAFNQLSKSNARKRFGLGLEDQPVPESEEEGRGRSVDLSRSKDEATTAEVTESSTSAPVIQPPSPSRQNNGHAKAQSTYTPIQTAGLWDSGRPEESSTKRKHRSLIYDREVKGKLKEKEKEKKHHEKFPSRILSIFRKGHCK